MVVHTCGPAGGPGPRSRDPAAEIPGLDYGPTLLFLFRYFFIWLLTFHCFVAVRGVGQGSTPHHTLGPRPVILWVHAPSYFGSTPHHTLGLFSLLPCAPPHAAGHSLLWRARTHTHRSFLMCACPSSPPWTAACPAYHHLFFLRSLSKY